MQEIASRISHARGILSRAHDCRAGFKCPLYQELAGLAVKVERVMQGAQRFGLYPLHQKPLAHVVEG